MNQLKGAADAGHVCSFIHDFMTERFKIDLVSSSLGSFTFSSPLDGPIHPTVWENNKITKLGFGFLTAAVVILLLSLSSMNVK